jgi:hypothetical protein
MTNFDLGKAMAKKGELESARLADFEFRQRARTFRLMAEKIGREADPGRVVAMIAQMDDAAILKELAADFPQYAPQLASLYDQCSAEARTQLIKERGDPTPHRLA